MAKTAYDIDRTGQSAFGSCYSVHYKQGHDFYSGLAEGSFRTIYHGKAGTTNRVLADISIFRNYEGKIVYLATWYGNPKHSASYMGRSLLAMGKEGLHYREFAARAAANKFILSQQRPYPAGRLGGGGGFCKLSTADYKALRAMDCRIGAWHEKFKSGEVRYAKDGSLCRRQGGKYVRVADAYGSLLRKFAIYRKEYPELYLQACGNRNGGAIHYLGRGTIR